MGYCRSSSAFICKVKTGDESGSGTNSDIGVRFLGDAGNSPVNALEYWTLDNAGNDNETGDEDWYCIPMDAIGFVHSIQVWFDPTGHTDGPDWKCDWIELCYPSGGSMNRWEINRWFRVRGSTEFSNLAIQDGSRIEGEGLDMKRIAIAESDHPPVCS